MKMSKAMESPIRKVSALSILSEFLPFLTKENKATAKLKMMKNRIDTIAILNTVIYSRIIL